MNIHQQRQHITLSVSLNSVVAMREKFGSDLIDLSKLALFAEEAGADEVTCYVQDSTWSRMSADVHHLAQMTIGTFVVEVTPTDPVLSHLLALPKAQICLVSCSTSHAIHGAVDLVGQLSDIQLAIQPVLANGRQVSAVILPEVVQVQAAAQLAFAGVRLDCSRLSELANEADQRQYLASLSVVVDECVRHSLRVSVGGRLRMQDIAAVSRLTEVCCINVDEVMAAQTVLSGWAGAVQEIKAFIVKSRLAVR